jgi:tetratricopeptide (TPR) repeat protein
LTKSKKIFIVALIAFVIVLGTVAVLFSLIPQTTVQNVASHISLAENYLLDLNYEAAIAEYRVAIEIDPKNPDNYIALAEVYTLIGDISSAEKVIEEGITAVDDEDKVKLKEIDLPATEPTTSASLSTETIQTTIPAISAESIHTTTTTPQTTVTTTTQIYPQDITFTMDSSEYKKLNEFFKPFDYYFDLASLVDEESLVAFAIWRCEVNRDGTFSIPQSDVENVLSEYFDIDMIPSKKT